MTNTSGDRRDGGSAVFPAVPDLEAAVRAAWKGSRPPVLSGHGRLV